MPVCWIQTKVPVTISPHSKQETETDKGCGRDMKLLTGEKQERVSKMEERGGRLSVEITEREQKKTRRELETNSVAQRIRERGNKAASSSIERDDSTSNKTDTWLSAMALMHWQPSNRHKPQVKESNKANNSTGAASLPDSANRKHDAQITSPATPPDSM
ncbi:Hypothetical predicted protein [Xyrichtys novacula]|uniref:Uncharacterized protein n=1 Tax=Xyrichtys novacula TaxID=13765 RepID=A0AAV1FD44_XYRNO|nr:Hypothetical predicted protein [Xyrichtys novacula]